jgi:hypothetical protein
MTHSETWTSGHRDMVHQHVKEDVGNGDAERDYADHVSAQKLSVLERVVVVGALVLLSFIGFTAPSAQTNATDPMTTSAIEEPTPPGDSLVSHHQRYGHCRETSPYADKVC